MEGTDLSVFLLDICCWYNEFLTDYINQYFRLRLMMMNSHIAVFVQRMPQSDVMAVTLTFIAIAAGSKSPDNLLLKIK
jgi:hypothetical protein